MKYLQQARVVHVLHVAPVAVALVRGKALEELVDSRSHRERGRQRRADGAQPIRMHLPPARPPTRPPGASSVGRGTRRALVTFLM